MWITLWISRWITFSKMWITFENAKKKVIHQVIHMEMWITFDVIVVESEIQRKMAKK